MLDPTSIYRLEDLQSRKFSGTMLAVLGHPITHSISPAIHNAVLAELRTKDDHFTDWQYIKLDIRPEELPEALQLMHQHRFIGASLTTPHKVQVLPLLAQVDTLAKEMEAANTLLWREEGYSGFNTDGFGLQQALQRDLNCPLTGAVVIIIGAGGAARAAAVECLSANCKQLWIINRSYERLAQLHKALSPLAAPGQLHTQLSNTRLTHLTSPDILINATSLGLAAGDVLPIDVSAFAPNLKVFDMIYNPPITPLLSTAKALGMQTANGLTMLIEQGAQAWRYWAGLAVTTSTMRQAAHQALGFPVYDN